MSTPQGPEGGPSKLPHGWRLEKGNLPEEILGQIGEAREQESPEKNSRKHNPPVGRYPFEFTALDRGGPPERAEWEEFIRVDVPDRSEISAAYRSATYSLLMNAQKGEIDGWRVFQRKYYGVNFFVVQFEDPSYPRIPGNPGRVALVHINRAGEGYGLYTTTAAFIDENLNPPKGPNKLKKAIRSRETARRKLRVVK